MGLVLVVGAVAVGAAETFKAMRGTEGFWRIAQTEGGVWWFVSPEGQKEFLNTVTHVHPAQRGSAKQGPHFVSRDWNGGPSREGGNYDAWAAKTQVQLCIVHKVRNSLKYVPWKERRAVAADLRALYGAATLPDAEHALERFAERWDGKYPAISPSWLADWDRLTVFFDYPPAIRRVVYTTNAIESLNYSLRKVLKGRSAFPNDEAIVKLLYMGLQHVAKKWTQPIPEWKAALNQFVILFGERVQV
jgi:hypothetical protein